MRYEAKHSSLKTIATRARNRINVCKTLAKKQQWISALALSDFMKRVSVDSFKKFTGVVNDRQFWIA